LGYYSSCAHQYDHADQQQQQHDNQKQDKQESNTTTITTSSSSQPGCCPISIATTTNKRLTTTPLHLAARRGHLPSCWILLLSNRTILDDVDEYGNTPLHTAAANGQLEIVKCLLNYGSDWTRLNVYHFTPFDVAMNDEIRLTLKHFAKDKKELFSICLRDKLQQEQRTKYDALELELKRKREKNIIASTSVTEAKDLQDIIEKSILMGIQSCLIHVANKKMEWIKVAGQIYEYSCRIRSELPMATILQLDEVKKFQKYLKNFAANVNDDPMEDIFMVGSSSNHAATAGAQQNEELPQELALLIDESNSLCNRCTTEYEIHSTCQSLMDIACASDSDKESLEKLNRILFNAPPKEQQEYLDKEIVSNAHAILSRLSSELKLKASTNNIPNVRLPVPGMSSKEEKTYWQPEDIGSLVVVEKKKLPVTTGEVCHASAASPSSTPAPAGEQEGGTAGHDEDFVWMKSAAYQKLENAIIQLQSDISHAVECSGNRELITNSQLVLKDAKKKRKILQSKDETDRLSAMATAGKTASNSRSKRTKKKKTITKKK
jgi:FOG: Ankyrin repeat